MPGCARTSDGWTVRSIAAAARPPGGRCFTRGAPYAPPLAPVVGHPGSSPRGVLARDLWLRETRKAFLAQAVACTRCARPSAPPSLRRSPSPSPPQPGAPHRCRRSAATRARPATATSFSSASSAARRQTRRARSRTSGWSTTSPTAARPGPPAVLRQRVQDPSVTPRRVLPHNPEDRRPGQPGPAAPEGQVHVDDPGVGQLPHRRDRQVPDHGEHPGAELHRHALGLARERCGDVVVGGDLRGDIRGKPSCRCWS